MLIKQNGFHKRALYCPARIAQGRKACDQKSIVEKLNDNAIIVADNIFFSEKIFANFVKEHDRNSVSGIKQFIRFLSKSEFLQTIFLDIGDGISVSVFKK